MPLALIWSLAVLGAFIDVPLGLIWAGGGIGDAPGPRDPTETSVFQLIGLGLFVLGILLVITLLWRVRTVWSFPQDPGAQKTARRVVWLTLPVFVLGAVGDAVRGDGKLFVVETLAFLNGPALAAGALVVWGPKPEH